MPFLDENKKNNPPETYSQRETIRAYLKLSAVKILLKLLMLEKESYVFVLLCRYLVITFEYSP